MSGQPEQPWTRQRVETEFLAVFERHRAELERVRAIVEPLCDSIPPYLKTKEILKDKSLTMREVIDHTVEFLREERDFVALCTARAGIVHDVISAVAGTLWLHYAMLDYDWLHIDPDPTFNCSRQIEDALRAKLEEVGLVQRAS